MNKNLLQLFLFLAMTAHATAAGVDTDKPNVVILATGGTIAGSAESQTQAGYSSGQVGIDILLGAVPQIADLADVSGEQIANVGSQDMSDAIWLQLANRINTLQTAPMIDGIVITHGTDTIEETAYFLNLVVKGEKPVVMTAAMRPSTALSADGPLNLFNAVAVAADRDARGRGVLIVANDDIHGARSVIKTNTTDVQTFSSPERGLIGVTLYGDSRYFRGPYRAHTSSSEFSITGVSALPRVDIVYMSAGASPDMITSAVANGARGIVIAGVGNGNMTSAALEAVRKVIANGVVVVRSSRLSSGAVGRNVEVDDDELGTIVSGELSPSKSRVLLKLALIKTSEPTTIQAYFDRY
jgi:L-asparaginase